MIDIVPLEAVAFARPQTSHQVLGQGELLPPLHSLMETALFVLHGYLWPSERYQKIQDEYPRLGYHLIPC